MFKVFVLAVLLFTTTQSMAGGAIGGGEVTFAPLVSCRAESIDPTFPNLVARLAVVAETDFDGGVLLDQPVKVITYDVNSDVIQYLQTVVMPAVFSGASLSIYQWSQVLPGESNPHLGELAIHGETGLLTKSSELAHFGELSLSECVFEGSVLKGSRN